MVKEFSNLSKINASANALIDAGRLFTSINPVIAKVTFFCDPLFRIELHYSKRTGFKAGLASITTL
jgi:hypothetical protein